MFDRTISEDLRWREKELAIIKLQLLRERSDVDRFRAVYRCLATLAYAHYEGFTKRLAAEVLRTISSRPTRPAECTLAIQNSLFAPIARKAASQKSNVELLAMFDAASAQNQLAYPDESLYYEISNLNTGKLEWLIQSIGLDFAICLPYKMHVGRLVDLRHRCAHGERISFDSSKTSDELANELLFTVSEVTSLMNLIGLEAIDLVATSRFLAPTH